MKILVVGGSTDYARWINRPIEFIADKIENVKDADLVLFTGGADVNPDLYGFGKNSKTYCDKERDEYEVKFYKKAIELKIPMVGICRGCQLITALQSRGLLIQDVTGHARIHPHEIEFNDGEKMLATSTHHQMMYPYNTSYELIAWSSVKLSERYEFDDNTIIDALPKNKEPEIVFYYKTNCLAIQPHPEYMDKNSRLVVKLNELLEEKFSL